MNAEERLRKQLGNARVAWRELSLLPREQKDAAIVAICDALWNERSKVLSANVVDVELARSAGISPAMLDRLSISEARLESILAGAREVADLPDPVGEILAQWQRPSGISIIKKRVPIGIIGMVFEGRPNVTLDSAVLCLKSGNCVLLRGSSSAIHSNRAITDILREALNNRGINPDCIQLFDSVDRSELGVMLSQRGLLDLVIPRGGKELIDLVCRTSAVPVLETGAGVCHVYLHHDADLDMAQRIVINAKTQRPSVCNSIETLLVHSLWPARNLAALAETLRNNGVECRACDETLAMFPWMVAATEQDWSTEYLDLTISIKIVKSIEMALDHIERYGTRHSEAIVTQDGDVGRRFQKNVDAAAVYVNSSTRFTDGFEFGFGAEIGISTQKLHARGPVGLKELTTYKYLVTGNGTVRKG